MQIALDFIELHWRHGLEILLLWFIIYHSYRYFRATRGARIFTGLVGAWIALTLLSSALDLNVIGWILEKIAVFLAVALVVIFQPELRRALAELGSHGWFSSFGGAAQRELTEELCDIVRNLARKRIGALIAIQRGIDAGVYVTRPGYGLLEMAYGAWSLVHGMAMLRIGHLTHFPMDYTAAERENLRRLGLGLMAQDAA